MEYTGDCDNVKGFFYFLCEIISLLLLLLGKPAFWAIGPKAISDWVWGNDREEELSYFIIFGLSVNG